MKIKWLRFDGSHSYPVSSPPFCERALGVFAELLGNSSVAGVMLNRSTNYRNVWDHNKQFMCERGRDGEFSCPLDPYVNQWLLMEDGFTEGTYVCIHACHSQPVWCGACRV